MSPGTSQAGRRVQLNRLYEAYRTDSAFADVRAEAGGVLVPGDGPMDPDLMFVGEAPGSRESTLRRPFMGQSGKFLHEMMESVGMSRDDVFVTNVVKYQPRKNRDPTPAEVESGRAYLWREHALLGYPPIVALGRHAARALGITSPVGEWGWSLGSFAPVLYLRHPAYGIYQRQNRSMMFLQFKSVLEPPTKDSHASQR
jgi:uracil-DNA glycosylase family 4